MSEPQRLNASLSLGYDKQKKELDCRRVPSSSPTASVRACISANRPRTTRGLLFHYTVVVTQNTSISENIERVWEGFSRQSPKRFARYVDPATNSHLDAMARYHWNVQLAEALTPGIHAIEICLRNAIHNAMRTTYPTSNDMWFDAWVGQGISREPLLLTLDSDQVQAARTRVMNLSKPVEAPRLVAQLSFGFWVELLNDDYDMKIVRPLLGGPMRNVKDPYRKQASLRELFGKFRELRNRVAHHEPIFDARDDLRHLHELMCGVSSAIEPQFTSLTLHGDRFETVWREGWQPFRQALLAKIKSSTAANG